MSTEAQQQRKNEATETVSIETLRRIRDTQKRGVDRLNGALQDMRNRGDDQILSRSALSELENVFKMFDETHKELATAVQHAERKHSAGAGA